MGMLDLPGADIRPETWGSIETSPLDDAFKGTVYERRQSYAETIAGTPESQAVRKYGWFIVWSALVASAIGTLLKTKDDPHLPEMSSAHTAFSTPQKLGELLYSTFGRPIVIRERHPQLETPETSYGDKDYFSGNKGIEADKMSMEAIRQVTITLKDLEEKPGPTVVKTIERVNEYSLFLHNYALTEEEAADMDQDDLDCNDHTQI